MNYRALRVVLKMLSHLPCAYSEWRDALGESLRRVEEALRRGEGIVAAFLLRFSLEVISQMRFLAWRSEREGVSIHELLGRYSKMGRAFTLKMVRSVPGLPGVYRKQLARTYLKLAHLTHPSKAALELAASRSSSLEEELLADALDFIALLALHHVPLGSLDRLNPEELSSVGLTRSSKYLAKKLRG